MALVSAEACPARLGSWTGATAAGERVVFSAASFLGTSLPFHDRLFQGEGCGPRSLSPPTRRFLFPEPLAPGRTSVSKELSLCFPQMLMENPCFSLEGNVRKAGSTATELASICKTKQGLCLTQRLSQPPGEISDYLEKSGFQ